MPVAFSTETWQLELQLQATAATHHAWKLDEREDLITYVASSLFCSVHVESVYRDCGHQWNLFDSANHENKQTKKHMLKSSLNPSASFERFQQINSM